MRNGRASVVSAIDPPIPVLIYSPSADLKTTPLPMRPPMVTEGPQPQSYWARISSIATKCVINAYRNADRPTIFLSPICPSPSYGPYDKGGIPCDLADDSCHLRNGESSPDHGTLRNGRFLSTAPISQASIFRQSTR
jgi:hypothetical protein